MATLTSDAEEAFEEVSRELGSRFGKDLGEMKTLLKTAFKDEAEGDKDEIARAKKELARMRGFIKRKIAVLEVKWTATNDHEVIAGLERLSREMDAEIAGLRAKLAEGEFARPASQLPIRTRR